MNVTKFILFVFALGHIAMAVKHQKSPSAKKQSPQKKRQAQLQRKMKRLETNRAAQKAWRTRKEKEILEQRYEDINSTVHL